ncbi:MAG: hypothetical protein WAV38_33185, partial [Xanthobacteraceae bacterium]
MICSSVNRLGFMSIPFRGDGLYSFLEEIPGLRSPGTIFDRTFSDEERKCRPPRSDASIGTLRNRGNGHCADRELNFSDLALIGLAARKSRKIKIGSRVV